MSEREEQSELNQQVPLLRWTGNFGEDVAAMGDALETADDNITIAVQAAAFVLSHLARDKSLLTPETQTELLALCDRFVNIMGRGGEGAEILAAFLGGSVEPVETEEVEPVYDDGTANEPALAAEQPADITVPADGPDDDFDTLMLYGDDEPDGPDEDDQDNREIDEANAGAGTAGPEADESVLDYSEALVEPTELLKVEFDSVPMNIYGKKAAIDINGNLLTIKGAAKKLAMNALLINGYDWFGRREFMELFSGLRGSTNFSMAMGNLQNDFYNKFKFALFEEGKVGERQVYRLNPALVPVTPDLTREFYKQRDHDMREAEKARRAQELETATAEPADAPVETADPVPDADDEAIVVRQHPEGDRSALILKALKRQTPKEA
jgi:hypothetical protein